MEDGTNLRELLLLIEEVELEGTVGDAAIVEGSYFESLLPEDLRHTVSHSTYF